MHTERSLSMLPLDHEEYSSPEGFCCDLFSFFGLVLPTFSFLFFCAFCFYDKLPARKADGRRSYNHRLFFVWKRLSFLEIIRTVVVKVRRS